MPPINIHAVFLKHDPVANSNTGGADQSERLADGLTLRKGNYLKATAEVGAFEQTLTTDLLNHLVFAQKVFMKVAAHSAYFNCILCYCGLYARHSIRNDCTMNTCIL